MYRYMCLQDTNTLAVAALCAVLACAGWAQAETRGGGAEVQPVRIGGQSFTPDPRAVSTGLFIVPQPLAEKDKISNSSKMGELP